MKAKEIAEKLKSPRKIISVRDLSQQLKMRSQGAPLFSLMLGAGASVQSKIKTGDNLVDEWRRSAYERNNKSAIQGDDTEKMKMWLTENCADWYDPHNEYASLFEWHYRLPKLRQKFVEESIDGKHPSIGYAVLTRLIEHGYFGTVFTTNFDDLVNESFHLFSEKRPIVCAHDSSVKGLSLTSSRPKIIKLHGDYLFDNIKCTTTDLGKLETNMKEKLTAFLTEYGLVIAGYSGKDKSVMSILKECANQGNYFPYGLFWVCRSESTISENVLDLLKCNNVFLVISDGFDEFMSELYYQIIGNNTPLFTSDLGLGVQTKVIKQYLDDKTLTDSQNQHLKTSVEEIRKMVTGGELSKIMRSMTSEGDRFVDFSDEELVRLLKIEQLLCGFKSFTSNSKGY